MSTNTFCFLAFTFGALFSMAALLVESFFACSFFAIVFAAAEFYTLIKNNKA